MKSRQFSFMLGLLIVLLFAGGASYFFWHKKNSSETYVPHVNVNSSTESTCKDIDEPWALSEFKNGIYKNAAFGFEATIPSGWYLLREDHTQKTCTPTNPTLESTSQATFGDAGKYWRVDIEALGNPENLTLSQWVQKYYRFDSITEGKKFGGVQTVYSEHAPLNLSDDDYTHIAVLQTGKWIEIISYFDKDSGMPRQAAFEKLIASVKAYSGESVSQVPTSKPDTQTSVNTTTDLYTSPALGFSIQMPSIWHVRTTKDSTQDVQYSDTARSIESTPKPLYYSDGVAPQHEDQVSTDGSAIDIGRSVYYNSKFSDYLDTAFQKDSYHQKAVTIGNGIKATRVETFGYTTKYSYVYVVLHGDYVYTLSIRSANATDEATISTMLKSFKFL